MLVLAPFSAYAQDADLDGIPDPADDCALVADPAQADGDGDGTGDACDVCAGPGDGLGPFGPPVVVGDASLVALGDVDGDGDPDVIVDSTSLLYTLSWYPNVAGAFGARRTLATYAGTGGPEDLGAVDLDGDGRAELVYAADDDVFVFAANLGAGGIAPRTVVGTGRGADSMAVADVDGDGDLDLLGAAAADDHGASWYPNLGGGAFGPGILVDPLPEPTTTLSPGDLDGDGDLDLVSVGGDGTGWYEGLGGGVFGPRVPLAAEAAALADLDGDGDLDVLVGEPSVSFLPNDGAGGFGPAVAIASDGFPEVTVGDLDGDGTLDVVTSDHTLGVRLGGPDGWTPFGIDVGEAAGLTLDDVDGDGDLDLAAIVDGNVRVYPNRSDCLGVDADADGAPDARELLVTGTDPASPDTDADGLLDGDEERLGADPLVADTDGDGFADGADTCPAGFDPVQADADGDGVGNACDVCAGDDAAGDADLDGICDDRDGCWGDDTSGDSDGDGICRDVDDCRKVPDALQGDADGDGIGDACDRCVGTDATGDLDRDGFCADADVCPLLPDPTQADADLDGAGDACDPCAAPGDGLDAFGPPQLLSAVVRSAGLVLDYDGDAVADVVTAETERVVLFPGLGGGGFGLAVPLVSEPGFVGYSDPAVVDLDGDGDLDVVARGSGNGAGWFEDLGAGAFAPYVRLTLDTAVAFRGDDVSVGDLDGDGDPDLLMVSAVDQTLGWYPNLGGGAFGAQVVLSANVLGGGVAVPIDLDGDGDLDVASAADQSGLLAVFQNRGGGVFGAAVVAANGLDGATQLFAADLDADGAEDLVLNTWGTIETFENLGGGALAAPVEIPTFYHGVAVADLDGDGIPELVAVNDRLSTYAREGAGYGGATVQDTEWVLDDVSAGDLDGDGDVDLLVGTDPTVGDARSGWLPNLLECHSLDADGDGLTDAEELRRYGSRPDLADTDGGGVDDGSEVLAGTNPIRAGDDGLLPPSLTVGPAGSLDVAGATPGARVLFLGSDPGSGWLATGPCAGTRLESALPLALTVQRTADPVGAATLAPPGGVFPLAVRVRALDTATCLLTVPVDVGP